MSFQEPFKFKDNKKMEKTVHENSIQMRSRMAILIPYKIYFKTKIITRDKEGHFIIIIKSLIHYNYNYEYIITNRAPKYMKQK